MQARDCSFYLGGLSCGGYRGYFQEFADEFSVPVLIEGGFSSGAGKILEAVRQQLAQSGQCVETICCSAHAGKLDALGCKGLCFVNATSPHAPKAVLPTAVEQVLSLYDAYDQNILVSKREELSAWTESGDRAFRRAARYLTAAAALIRENEQAVLTCTDLSKAEQLGRALAKRYLRQGGANGRVHVRLLSAVTSGGICFLPDAISSVETLVVLEDEYGAAADRILHILQQHAAEHGLDIIACPCPVRPKHLEHLIFPQLSTAFVTANRYHSEYSGNPRRIHCTRFSEKSGLRARRARLRFNRKMAEELMAQVFGALTEAGEAQKAVDAVYSAAEIPEKMEKVCIRAKELASSGAGL